LIADGHDADLPRRLLRQFSPTPFRCLPLPLLCRCRFRRHYFSFRQPRRFIYADYAAPLRRAFVDFATLISLTPLFRACRCFHYDVDAADARCCHHYRHAAVFAIFSMLIIDAAAATTPLLMLLLFTVMLRARRDHARGDARRAMRGRRYARALCYAPSLRHLYFSPICHISPFFAY
jgi:hypothetical protein